MINIPTNKKENTNNPPTKNYWLSLLISLFSSWCLIQSIYIWGMSLEDALGTYKNLSPNDFLIILLLCILLTFILHQIQHRQWLTALELGLLSLLIYTSMVSLRSPFPSVSLGLLLVDLAIVMLLLRNKSSLHPYTLPVTGILITLNIIKLVYNLLPLEPQLDPSRFTIFFATPANNGITLDQSLILTLAGLVVTFLVAYYYHAVSRKDKMKTSYFNHPTKMRNIILIATLICWIWLGFIMVTRTLTLRTPTYDMGIFTQMFHNMATTGLPNTTLERDQLLSHFAVHISPIYYLMLPIFMIFPSPVTLQILQLVVVISAVIPMVRIARTLKLAPIFQVLLAGLTLLSPAMLGNNLYDLHENCFLAPLLLWLADSLLRKKWPQSIIFTILTLMVKEDAALYVISLGLWTLAIHTKTGKHDQIRRFILLIVLPFIWFALCIYLLNLQGQGAMLGRFSNLNAYPDWGLPGLIITLLQHPTPVLAGMFTPAKLSYLFLLLPGLGFLPLMHKREVHYLLLIPLVVMNLLGNWPYQHDITFQYGYGSTASLLLSVAVFLAEASSEASNVNPSVNQISNYNKVRESKSIYLLRRQGALAVVLSLALGYSFTISTTILNFKTAPFPNIQNNLQIANQMWDMLDDLPRDQRILASTMLTSALGDVPQLYDAKYHNKSQGLTADPTIDIVLLDRRFLDEDLTDVEQRYRDIGYTESEGSLPYLLILLAPE